MALANKVIYQNGAIREFEKPEVCKAIKVANANKWVVCLSPTEWDERKARLKKEHEENTKATVSGEEQSKEGDLKAATKMFGAQAREIMRLTAENAELRETIDKMKEGNPALKEALKESATQFNDALLHEQVKKIKRLGKEIARLNKIIHKKNLKIEELGKESSRHLRGKMKMFGENFDLEQELKDKNAVLSDVAEELRLLKIREKNLTEVSQKYMKEVEDLREKLAEKTNLVEMVRKCSEEYCEYGIAAEKMIRKMAKEMVNDKPVSSKDYEQYRLWAKGYRFDPQLLDFSEEEEKSAESALAYKDEVIETLEKELAEAKHELSSLKRPFRPDSTGAVVLFANAYAKAEKKHLRCAEWKNDGKEVSATYILENGKKSKIALDFTGDEIIFSRTDPDKPRKDSLYFYKDKQLAEKDEVISELGKELDEANKHQQQAYRSCADKNKEIIALKLQISALEKRGNGIDWKRNADAIKLYVNRASHERLWSPISQDICNEQELSFIINHGGKRVKYALRFDGTDIVYECSDPDKKPSFFRDDSVGAVTNQKDCSPVKDTNSTEDNPEEIEIEKAVKLVRKAMKEGRTVTIDYKD